MAKTQGTRCRTSRPRGVHLTRDSGGRTALSAHVSRALRAGTLILTATLVAPALIAYLPFLDKGFVSEDFLLIALHREQPPWQDIVATFTRPWLEMRVFEFYRPFATLAFGAESVLFGAWSLGYNAVHLAVHLFSTVLLWMLLRGLLFRAGTEDAPHPVAVELAAFVGVLYVSLYPTAPNSVMFAGSFANVFGAAATLAAALLYVRCAERTNTKRDMRDREETLDIVEARTDAVRSRGFRWIAAMPVGAIVAFTVGLGCYESAAALPIWLVLYETTNLAFSRRAPGTEWRQSWRRAAIAFAPFALILIGYVQLRGALFGEALGGYSNVADRLRGFDVALLAQAARAMGRLLSPWYGPGAGAQVELLVGIGIWLALAVWVFFAAAVVRRELVRALVLGGGWALAFLAPFSFPLIPPAADRYWYLASAGVGIALAVAIVRTAGATNSRRASIGRRCLKERVPAVSVRRPVRRWETGDP